MGCCVSSENKSSDLDTDKNKKDQPIIPNKQEARDLVLNDGDETPNARTGIVQYE